MTTQNNTVREFVRPVRHNARCTCKRAYSVLVSRTSEYVTMPSGFAHGRMYQSSATVYVDAEGFKYLMFSEGIGYTCACGRALYLAPVRGKYVQNHKCDARCVNATGHSCECACGGKNHGSGYQIA